MKQLYWGMILCIGIMSPVLSYASDTMPYAGAGIGAFGIGVKPTGTVGVSQKNTVLGGFVKLGLNFNDYTGLELRFGMTGTGSHLHSAGAGNLGLKAFTGSIKLDRFYSYLAKAQLRLTQDTKAYALLGATTARLKATTSLGSSGSFTKTGLSYGGGVEYTFADNFTASIEYIQYWNGVKYNPAGKGDVWGASYVISAGF